MDRVVFSVLSPIPRDVVMKKFFVGFVIVLALLLGAGGLGLGIYNALQAFENQEVADVDKEVEVDLTQIAGYTPDPKKGDVVTPLTHTLKGGNTLLVWETGKEQLGTRHEFDGTWTSLGGAVVFSPDQGELKALQVQIVVESFNSYSDENYDKPAKGGLINTVLGKPNGVRDASAVPWFDFEKYPTAVFTSSGIVVRTDSVTTEFANAPEGWTHLIKGDFDLNGKKLPLELPAEVFFDGSTMSFATKFTISRKAYGVEPKSPLPGTTVDDLVEITATFVAEPDAGQVVDALADTLAQTTIELGRQLDGLKGELDQKNSEIALLTDKIAGFERTIQSLEKKVASGVGPTGPGVDLANLPKDMNVELTYPPNAETGYAGKGPFPIELALVSGDPAANIQPFYMAKHEVTWEMFYDWAYSADITPAQSAELQKKMLRPSPLYEDCNQLKLGLEKRPAISMSRTTAEAFAKWVSERTGKNFRLPTNSEWDTALKLGGGVPASEEDLLKQAVFIDNAEEQFDPPFLYLTGEVGSKAPNALGIYDLLGNATEWVTDTGAERVARGGHFKLESSELTADWKAVEDQGIWNETYPQLPLSKFWYRDHYYQGIRLVCDPQ